MALRLVVSGATGRMGGALGRLIRDSDDLTLVGGIAPHEGADGPYERIVPVSRADELIEGADALVDFSALEQLSELVDAHGQRLEGRSLVVGTTGLDEALEERLRRLAEGTAVLVASNFSVGVNLLLHLVRQAAAALPSADFDAEIAEAHHRRKEDAPSGTALSLGRALAQARDQRLDDVRRDGRSGRPGARPDGEIGLHALRGGGVVGEHRVFFLGERERVELAHAASDRDVFADGALRAVRWLAGREPGRYSMEDVLGLGGERRS